MNNTILDLLLFNQTIKRLANSILSNRLIITNPIYKYFYNKRINSVIKQYQDKPFSLRIENTNFCNGRCFMCPYPTMKRKKGIMSRELFKKIVAEAKENDIKYINLHNFGEPLLEPDFVWRVKYAKSQGIERISTNTNGTFLTKKLAQELIDSGLDELYISVDAASKKTYDKIRIGLNYRLVDKNIKYIAKLKKKLKSSKPLIVVDFLRFHLNVEETNKFVNKWKNVVDRVCISQIHDWSSKKDFGVDQNIKNYVQFSQAPCRLPFTELLINWDGTVSICCQDIEGEVILGDTNKDNIIDIWKNEKFAKIRQSHLNLDTSKLKVCQNCKLRTFWWTF